MVARVESPRRGRKLKLFAERRYYRSQSERGKGKAARREWERARRDREERGERDQEEGGNLPALLPGPLLLAVLQEPVEVDSAASKHALQL